MSLYRFVAIFVGIGLAIPVSFKLFWAWIEHSRVLSFSVQYYVHSAMLLLWPTSIINLGGAGNDILANRLFIISLILNALAYGLFGFLVWIGLRQHRWLLIVLIIIPLLLWWHMLTL